MHTWSEKFSTRSKYTIPQFTTLAIFTKISDESSHIIRTVSDCNKSKQLKRKKASGLIELAMLRLSLNQDQLSVSLVLSAFKAPPQLGKNKSFSFKGCLVAQIVVDLNSFFSRSASSPLHF